MAHIELTISNISNNTYPEVILRKFFHMVFVSADGKKLSIYTATVFGGVKAREIKEGDEAQKGNEGSVFIPKCEYMDKSDCSLKFEYSSSAGYIKEVSFHDLTASLWTQTACVQQVWGGCEPQDTQDKVKKIFAKVYPDVTVNSNINMKPDWPIYYIHEAGKANHDCIVAPGNFEVVGGNDSRAYWLRTDVDLQYSGMEFMNWIKTEIVLFDSILDKHVSFKINLDNADGCKYYTPDFTWYFAPPAGYGVDRESATVKIAKSNERNLVQSVAGDTTVNFKEWTKDEQIGDRKKARVYVSQQTIANPCVLSDNNGIEVGISIKNPHQMENKQFFIGLLIAFLLSFCSDKTRLNDYHACIGAICDCGAGCICGQLCSALSFLFPVLALLSYMSLMFSAKKCVPVNSKAWLLGARLVKGIGFGCTIAVMLYVFLAWPVLPGVMKTVVKTCAVNQSIIISLVIIGMIANAIYVIYCMCVRKKKLYDYI